MRADRLVATLLLLQARQQVTAAEVAEELEVSERTARRDLEALGMAGLPVYSLQGRHGGWRLAGRGTTDLTGLTAPEARALFLVAGPASATPEVRAALRKLVRALPEPFRHEAEAATEAVVVDPSSWGRSASPRPAPTHLDALQHAVVSGAQVNLGYIDRQGITTSRVVDPLGLATKGSTWYLVGGTEAGQRTFRVDRVKSVEHTGARVARPENFDLAEAWRLITAEIDERRLPVRARAWAQRDAVSLCRYLFGPGLRIGPAGTDGRIEVELRGASVAALAGQLAGLGAVVEIVDPPEVRARLAEIGAQLLGLYA